MKRRYFLGLVGMSPFAWYGFARSEENWLPVPVGSLPANSLETQFAQFIFANVRQVLVGDAKTLFNVKTGQQRSWIGGLITPQSGTWEITQSEIPQLILRQDGKTATYDFPDYYIWQAFSKTANVFQYKNRVSMSLNHVDLMTSNFYCRWETRSGYLERSVGFWQTREDPSFELSANSALKRDGETIVNADFTHISFVSPYRREILRRVPVVGVTPLELTSISPFGTYAFYMKTVPEGEQKKLRVVNTSNGQILWTLNLDAIVIHDTDYHLVSPDEKVVAVPMPSSELWQIHDLRNGALLRTLPLVNGALTGAFSPDGATLYSVANGVLYRQRAR